MIIDTLSGGESPVIFAQIMNLPKCTNLLLKDLQM